ncbi:MAG: hypothetical protein JW915_23695, partial [Chitinispirillaceae bacterium]|nr:hypothetical protein [Chitinispirillaceae bacterium]
MKYILMLIFLSYNIYSETVGKQSVIDTSTVSSFNVYCVNKLDTSVSISIRRPVTLTGNLVIQKNLRIASIENGATINLAGYNLTLRNCTDALPESCFVGSGTIIFDTCATTYFDTRWIGSASLSYSWYGCNGDTVKFTSLQANTAGINAANITTTNTDSLRIGYGVPFIFSKLIGAYYGGLAIKDTTGVNNMIFTCHRVGINVAEFPRGTLEVKANSSGSQPTFLLSNYDYNTVTHTGSAMMLGTSYVSGNGSYFIDVFNNGAESKGNLILQRTDGGVMIGKTTSTFGYKLDVNGKILASDDIVAPDFRGQLTGDVIGNVSGSSGSCTGNSATVTNGVYTSGSYANPAWLTSIAGDK